MKNELRQHFEDVMVNVVKNAEQGRVPSVLVQVMIPPSGFPETIVNYYDAIPEKLHYLKDNYDDEFRLKANPNVRMIGFLLL